MHDDDERDADKVSETTVLSLEYVSFLHRCVMGGLAVLVSALLLGIMWW